ncbi:hypothetical protein MMC30_003449 [Trapelia coarctata]|nr:hypothetical protein [Trapelia coarctata]
MAGEGEDSDDYGFSSADEAELLALTAASEATTQGTNWKDSPTAGAPAAKRTKIQAYATTSPLAVTALTRSFGLNAFRLKIGAGNCENPWGWECSLAFSEVDKLENIRGEGEYGITLVVSPLIALMKDQVDALVRRGITAACFDSTKSREEYFETCNMLRQGTLKLLYCAPERLNNEGFIEQMKTVRGGIRLVAVDEAHFSRFVKEIKAERVVCLTATATPRVAHDICDAFDVDKIGLFRTSTYRPNLHLLAESAMTKQELYPKLFSFLRSHPGPSIVYVTLQKQTEALAADLRAQGFKTKAFHAGMQTPEKTALQDEFMAKQDLIIVATIAFEWEIGRDGGDGRISNCLFYVCGEDLHLREIFARGDLPSRESLRGLLGDIFNPTNAKLTVDEKLQNCGLNFCVLSPIYSKYSYTPGGRYYGVLTSDKSGAAAAIKVFATQARTLYHIDVQAAAVSKGVNWADIVRKLNEWNDSHVIELKTAGVLNVYRVLKKLPSTTGEIDVLVKDMYSQMEAREQQALDRTEEMLNLITGNACFSKLLAQHFGDDLPDGRAACGHCTWCQTRKPVVLQSLPEVPFNGLAFNAVLKAVPDRDDARFLARVAFGITNLRVTSMKVSKDPIFGSMADHDFMTLLRAFTTVCSKDNQSAASGAPFPGHR